ncbi:MAG: PD-(D/E)XK nuclease family protein [Elusimicrobiota bacterium]
MSKVLVNEFSWSVSRQRSFDECKRKYYYTYYGSWDGWNHDADETKRKCYMLKNMSNLPMFTGSVVHEVVQEILERMRDGKESDPAERAMVAENRLLKGIKQSEEGEWKKNSKQYINLFEHYYGGGINSVTLDTCKTAVMQCTTALFSNRIFERIKLTAPVQWRSIELLESTKVDAYKVWVKFDFALEINNEFHIVDWKTGREHEEDLAQLACYAFYAKNTKGIDPDKIALTLVYLRDNTWRTERITGEQVDDVRKAIVTNCVAMQELLDDKENNVASEKMFPKTDKKYKCKRCNYKELCGEK